MNILFVEPEILGHQQDHIRLVSEAVEACEDSITAVFLVHPDFPATTDHARTSYLRLRDSEFRAWTAFPLWRRSMARWSIARRYAKKCRADHVHFLNFDHMQLALGLHLSLGTQVKVSGTLFRPFVHYTWLQRGSSDWRERIKSIRQSVLLRSCLRRRDLTVLFSLDPFFPLFAAERWKGVGTKVVGLPDPAMNRAVIEDDALPRDYFPPDRKVFTLFGALAKRKGVIALLRALRALDDATARQCAFVLAGAVDAGMAGQLGRQAERLRAERPDVWLRIDDRRLSGAELNALVHRSDVILAPYQRFVGSSGVLLWAAAAGKPVLTQEYGLVGELTRRHQLGLVVDTTDPGKIARGIRALADDPGAYTSVAGMADFVSRQRPADYKHVLTTVLLQASTPSAGH